MKKIVLIVFIALPMSLYSQWVKKANFPDTRIFPTAFSVGNYGYVGGGILGTKYVRDFWRYDLEADIWEPIDSLPVPHRSTDAVSFAINGKGYVCCTFGVSTDVWEYDPVTGKWTQKADTPENYSQAKYSRVAFSIGNYGYLFAGNDLYPGSPGNNFFQYDPETDTWTEKATCPVNRITFMVGFSLKGKGYIGTGHVRFSDEDNQFWEYDPELDQWSRIADFPSVPRTGAVGFNTGNYGYVGSGQKHEEISEGTRTASDFWRYDPESGAWEQVDSIRYNTSDAFAFSINGKGYMGGGQGIQEGEFWEYSPVTNAIKNKSQTEEFLVYPNPASNKIILVSSGNTKIKKIEMADFSGRIIKQWRGLGTGENVLQIESVLPGIYLLKAETEKGIATKKLIIQ